MPPPVPSPPLPPPPLSPQPPAAMLCRVWTRVVIYIGFGPEWPAWCALAMMKRHFDAVRTWDK
eukprot:1157330-Pelagomonas_calceolata.AAC.1